MKAPSALDVLRERAADDTDQAAKRLGQVRHGCQQASAQLEQLLDYEQEYRQKLHQGLADGMASTSYRNYQQFIITLETAIEQHRILLAQWNERVRQAVAFWQSQHQRLNALTTLHARNLQAEQRRSGRREQKTMDEFASRAAQRKSS